MIFVLKLFILFMLWISPLALFAQSAPLVHTLFFTDPETQQMMMPDNYSEILSTALPGDYFQFKKGMKFRIGDFINCGNTTCIFELLDFPDRVLRVPKNNGIFSDGAYFTDYLTSTLNNGEVLNSLADAGSKVAVHVYDGRYHQFAVVEKVSEKHFTFYDYANHRSKKSGLNPYFENQAFAKEVEEALLHWVKNASELNMIGDFHSEQLVYEVPKKRWILLDWSEGTHRIHSHSLSGIPMDKVFYQYLLKIKIDPITQKKTWTYYPDYPAPRDGWLPKLAEKMEKTMIEERRRRHPAWFNADGTPRFKIMKPCIIPIIKKMSSLH